MQNFKNNEDKKKSHINHNMILNQILYSLTNLVWKEEIKNSKKRFGIFSCCELTWFVRE